VAAHRSNTADAVAVTFNLNKEQKQALNACTKIAADEQVLLLLHGGPGTGKTHTCAAVEQYLRTFDKTCLAASAAWAAVFQMRVNCKKLSLHKLLKSGISLGPRTLAGTSKATDWPPAMLHGQFATEHQDVSLFIIDEISTTASHMLVALDRMLRAAFRTPNTPFGGRSILLLGDFCQIPPVKDKSIADHLVTFASSSASGKHGTTAKERVSTHAASLFAKFRRVLLTQNERCPDDEYHQILCDRFRFTGHDDFPITESYIKGFQRLDPALLKKDPAFEDAVFAVQTNQERVILSKLHALRFAKRKRKPIYRWTLPMRKAAGRSRASYEDYDDTRKKYESAGWVSRGAIELEFFFVEGMPLIVTENYGHASWKIANQRPCKAHSFTFAPGRNFTMPPASLTPSGAGQIFHIPQPDFVNVVIPPLGSDPVGTLPMTVPIAAKDDEGKVFKEFLKHAPKVTQLRYKVHRGLRKRALSREDGDHTPPPHFLKHPLDPGFAVTYHKLQGVTAKRVILVLHDLKSMGMGNFSLQQLYVGLSRVRDGKHFAVWPATDAELHFLTKLKRSTRLRAWFGHYDDNGVWKKERLQLRNANNIFRAIYDSAKGPKLENQRVDRKQLKACCSVYGIFYRGKSYDELVGKLAPYWDKWIKEKPAAVGDKRRTSTDARPVARNKRQKQYDTARVKQKQNTAQRKREQNTSSNGNTARGKQKRNRPSNHNTQSSAAHGGTNTKPKKRKKI
jgi:hypothetical protein